MFLLQAEPLSLPTTLCLTVVLTQMQNVGAVYSSLLNPHFGLRVAPQVGWLNSRLDHFLPSGYQDSWQ